MPQFTYKAKSGPRDVVTGYIQADTVAQAIDHLIRSGHTPIEVKLRDKKVVALPVSSEKSGADTAKVSQSALFQFTRQLADLMEAGISLIRCMDLLSRQKQFPVMVRVVDTMAVHLRQGGSLSFALSKHPAVFSALYVNTVKAAEASGQLPLVLNRLAQFLEQDLHMRERVKSSLLYPAVIFLVGALTIFVLFSFVLPRMTMMFEDFDATLPLVTRIVVGLSQFFAKSWWIFVCIAILAFIFIRRFLITSRGKAWFDAFVLKIPILKSFIENTQLSRFGRTLGMLLESGVPVVSALQSVTGVVDNVVLQEEVKKVAVKVRDGTSLTQAIKASPFFPEVAVDLITVGQESGKLEKGLYKLAAGCERSSQELAQTFVTVLGPAVLVVVVSIVGFMIVAILLPMFQMNTIIN